MQTSNNLPVVASGRGVDLLEFQGGTWVDGETIGRQLGYEHPRRSINNLFNRYRNDFLDGETCIIKLMTQVSQKNEPCTTKLMVHDKQDRGQRREVRLFSVPRGVFRICMLSRAKNAVEAHDAILDTFDRYRFGQIMLTGPAQPGMPSEWFCREMKKVLGGRAARRIIREMAQGVYSARPFAPPLAEIARIEDQTERAAMVRKWARDNGKSLQTAYRRLSQARTVIGAPKLRKTRRDKGTHRNEISIEGVA